LADCQPTAHHRDGGSLTGFGPLDGEDRQHRSQFMLHFQDLRNRAIRLTDERLHHLETDHPEMAGQTPRIAEALANPDRIVRSRTDVTVELFYKWYPSSPVTAKFLCVVVKTLPDDQFIITAYYTDAVKRGEVLWEKQ
jgi:hypothetical protein